MKRRAILLAMCGLSQLVTAYEVHEWGTFTTVSGSDGGMLTGLQVEEEHLPNFVYSHIGMKTQTYPFVGNMMTSFAAQRHHSNQLFVMLNDKDELVPMTGSKGMPMASLKNVTVKMETPVIYFYGDDTPKVNVKVGFNGGTISQWYPNRTSGDTPNLVTGEKQKLSDSLKEIGAETELVMFQPIDFSEQYNGAIEWDVEVLPKSEADPAYTFKSDENHTWIYPRVSDANMVKVGDEYEDYLFYRGVGNFKLPVKFSVNADETLVVSNQSDGAIPFAFAFENVLGKFRYKVLGSVAAGVATEVAEGDWVTPENQQVEVFQQMRAGLVAQGLTTDEANGMIKTWWKSYFDQPGLRVFWVMPQADLEKTLPLTLSPTPERTVRVMVGRADVMRPKLEQDMIAALGTHTFDRYQSNRFILPYTNRLEQLVDAPVYWKFEAENMTNRNMTLTAKRGISEMGEGINLTLDREVKTQHLKLEGKWRVIGQDILEIGETRFKLDPNTGILTAKADLEEDYDVYEIQLPRVLN